jgi:hypothetical protein
MTKRISSLKPGETVTLKFATYGEPTIEAAQLVEFKEDGQTAVFQTDMGTGPTGIFQWEAYRFNGRWCYGSSAQRVSIVD